MPGASLGTEERASERQDVASLHSSEKCLRTSRAVREGVLPGCQGPRKGHRDHHSSAHTWGDSVGWCRGSEMGAGASWLGREEQRWAGQSWVCAVKPEGQHRHTPESYGNDSVAGLPRKKEHPGTALPLPTATGPRQSPPEPPTLPPAVRKNGRFRGCLSPHAVVL